jgi:DNA invertase Pin-like site-specific DNA recombinase
MTKRRIVPAVTTGLVGYARVSTLDQNLAMQEKALKQSRCLKIFTDRASGKNMERPGLDEALKFLREGDTLVVWKLDRLGRSLQDLIKILDDLTKRGIKFQSLQEHITTDTAAGRMFFQMIGTFAEFERNLISERTHNGLAAARAHGRVGGRKAILNSEKVAQARALLTATPPTKFIDVCRLLQCSTRTLRRGLYEFPQLDVVESQPTIKPGRVTRTTAPPPRDAGAQRHA